MRLVWNRIRQFAFYPEEERIYIWILIGPLFLTLLLIPHLSKFAPLQLTLALGSISLSWILAIIFGLETLQIAQKMRSFEGQVGGFETEKGRLIQNHQSEIDHMRSTADSLYGELDEASKALSEEKLLKEAAQLGLEKERALLETLQQTILDFEDEMGKMKEKFRVVNSELKVYKSSSYTRYEVKHIVDELNRYRVKEKQLALLAEK
ncbi:MAG: hypothetical protein FJZ61_03120 [Chlamydiae bacterium]|nr:hypothetical protein [Chlamydiota bacterium]